MYVVLIFNFPACMIDSPYGSTGEVFPLYGLTGEVKPGVIKFRVRGLWPELLIFRNVSGYEVFFCVVRESVVVMWLGVLSALLAFVNVIAELEVFVQFDNVYGALPWCAGKSGQFQDTIAFSYLASLVPSNFLFSIVAYHHDAVT